LLELEEAWEAIKDFEGKFLGQSYFRDVPRNRAPYEPSYRRIRRAYAKLAVPLPKEFRVPPTSELVRATELLKARKCGEARQVFAEMVENEDYRQMDSRDAIAALAGYAESIKRQLRVLTLEDWQEVYRSLSILVRDYRNTDGFISDYLGDLEAARRQTEKLKPESTTL
jgi:signal recognition particle subunit SEC65